MRPSPTTLRWIIIAVLLVLWEALPRIGAISPLFLPPPNLPIHAVVGSTEGVEYTRQSRSIAEAWGGTWEAAEGANHFTVVEPLADPRSTLVATALGMLSG